jgi:hypothetical protein
MLILVDTKSFGDVHVPQSQSPHLPCCSKFLVEIALVKRPPEAEDLGRNFRGFLNG